jgi:hypothetical protein
LFIQKFDKAIDHGVYGDVIWDNCSEEEAKVLEHVQYEAARVVTGAIKGTSAIALHVE